MLQLLLLLSLSSVGSYHTAYKYFNQLHSRNYNNNELESNRQFHQLLYRKNNNDESPIKTVEKMTAFTAVAPSNTYTGIVDGVWGSRILLLIVSAFYGTNFGCVKILGETLDASVASVIRFVLAAIVFVPFLIGGIKSNPNLVKGGLEIGAYNSLGYWAQANALKQSDASTVAFICSLAVVFVPFLDMIFGHHTSNSNSDDTIEPSSEETEKVSMVESLLPAFMAAAGVACLELGGNNLPGVGDLWALLQPILFGLSFWRIERHMTMSNSPSDSMAFTGAMLSVVAVFSSVWSLHDFFWPHYLAGGVTDAMNAAGSQWSSVVNGGWQVPAALLWTGLVTTALTQFGENTAMKKLDAAESTLIFSTEPLWGAAFAAVTLGESIGRETIIGAVLILSACAYRSIGYKVAALLSGLQLTDTVTMGVIEEVSENVGANVVELIEKIMENSETLPP